MRNWRRSIKRAMTGSGFTDTERSEAMSWTSCAVGEAHFQHPRLVKYRKDAGHPKPDDLRLLGLGVEFYYAVESDDPFRAADLYGQIQKRIVDLELGIA
jgi:hypothetical protein